MKKWRFIFMDSLIVFLMIYLLFAICQLFRVEPPPELPLTQEEAAQIGEKFLRSSFPGLFNQKTENHKLEMEIMVVDKGDTWEVFNYHEPHFIETKDGRKIWPGYASNFVVLEKSTGNIIEVGF